MTKRAGQGIQPDLNKRRYILKTKQAELDNKRQHRLTQSQARLKTSRYILKTKEVELETKRSPYIYTTSNKGWKQGSVDFDSYRTELEKKRFKIKGLCKLMNAVRWDKERDPQHCADIQCHCHRVVAWPNGIRENNRDSFRFSTRYVHQRREFRLVVVNFALHRPFSVWCYDYILM